MNSSTPISLEFFPPKTPEGAEKLRTIRQVLYALKPQFCLVTFGAGGLAHVEALFAGHRSTRLAQSAFQLQAAARDVFGL